MEGEGAWFSPRTSGTKRKCCVPKCTSVSESSPHLRFHAFPKEGEIVSIENGEKGPECWDRREYWMKVLKVSDPLAKKMFVCSRHFLRSDYLLPDHAAKQRHLKRVAVPSLNLPRTTPVVKDLWKCGSQSGQRWAKSRKKVTLVSLDSETESRRNYDEAAKESQMEVSQQVGLQERSVDVTIKGEVDGGLSTPRNAPWDEVITDDIPSQEMLTPVPVKLVEVSTGKEIHFNGPVHSIPEEGDKDVETQPECATPDKEEENIFEPNLILIPQKVEHDDYQPPSSEEDDDEDFEVVPREETLYEALDNREAIIKEEQLEDDVGELNVGEEDAESVSTHVVENKEGEAEDEGIRFNALETKLAIKEEIDIVEWNTPSDMITEDDSKHFENEEYGSHGNEVFPGRTQISPRNVNKDQQTLSAPLHTSCSNNSVGLQNLRSPQKREREEDEVILTESVNRTEDQHQSITIENGPNYGRKELKEVDVSAKGKEMVGFEPEQSENGISRKEVEYVQCHHCGERRVTLNEMKEHIYTVHFSPFIGEDTRKSKRNNHTCIFCHKVLKYRCLLAKHLLVHTGEKPLKCDQCQYRCSNSSYLKEHLRTHTGEKPFKCHLCEFRCSGRSALKVHLRRHTGEKPFKCNLCEYRATQRAQLNLHLHTHTGEKPFKCHLCEFRCSGRSALNVHLRIHTGEKPFKCDLCEYRASRPYHLNVHLRRHTGEKPFECHICVYRASQRSQLKMHLRTHTGEKPYKCHLCEHRCSVRSALKSHLRTHTGEKPFECQMCDYRSTRSFNLKKHMLSYHQRINS